MSEVQIFSFLSMRTPHLAALCEIAIDEARKGEKVRFFYCDKQIKKVGVMDCGIWGSCCFCLARAKKMQKILSKESVEFSEFKIEEEISPKIEIPPEVFASEQNFQSYIIEGFDVGSAVASTSMNHKRETKFFSAFKREDLEMYLKRSVHLYRQLLKHFQRNRPNKVIIFNARLSPDRAVYRATESLGIPVEVVEVAGTLNKYIRLINERPHDFYDWSKEIEELWSAASSLDLDQKTAVGSKWFEDSRYKPQRPFLRISGRMKKGKLPKNLDLNKKIISIFASSDDERLASGAKAPKSMFETQIEGIRTLVKHFEDRKDIQLVLRIHPNLSNLRNSQMHELLCVSAQNLVVVKPEARVDSYELLARSNIAVSFWSTIGIEATYWGCPSIALAANRSNDLNVVYTPKEFSEFCRMIDSDLPPKPKIQAVKFGYWKAMKGIPYKYYDRGKGYPWSGRFLGKSTQPCLLSQFRWRVGLHFRIEEKR